MLHNICITIKTKSSSLRTKVNQYHNIYPFETHIEKLTCKQTYTQQSIVLRIIKGYRKTEPHINAFK